MSWRLVPTTEPHTGINHFASNIGGSALKQNSDSFVREVNKINDDLGCTFTEKFCGRRFKVIKIVDE